MPERTEFHPLPPDADESERIFPARKLKRIREDSQPKKGEVDLTEELKKLDPKEQATAFRQPAD